MVYNEAAMTLDAWLRGNAIPSNAIIQKLKHAAVAFTTWAQSITDACTLIDANPGTIRPTTSGSSGTVPQNKRTWP